MGADTSRSKIRASLNWCSYYVSESLEAWRGAPNPHLRGALDRVEASL